MAITIVSGAITSIHGARSNRPAFNGGNANFTCSAMHCEGNVHFNGLPTDSRAGWDIGWVQAQWIETNWGYYRGHFDRHGSIFIQRARAPARPQQACRDTSGAVGDVFTDPTDGREFQHLPDPATPFPLVVNVQSNDPPGESYPGILTNAQTHQPNFLHEVQLEFHFCTVLTVRDPPGTFHQLAHFYWNLHWQYRFQPTAFPAPGDGQWSINAVSGGNASHAGHVCLGRVTDPRFTGVLTTPQTSSCVNIAAHATANPNRRDFQRWESVDVRR